MKELEALIVSCGTECFIDYKGDRFSFEINYVVCRNDYLKKDMDYNMYFILQWTHKRNNNNLIIKGIRNLVNFFFNGSLFRLWRDRDGECNENL
ncbi:hypothetical protein CUU64_01535 [Bacillus sp. V5-8f]|nr:hypothetical protein CUU64_01535 [Bacillus sp. V5-8f]